MFNRISVVLIQMLAAADFSSVAAARETVRVEVEKGQTNWDVVALNDAIDKLDIFYGSLVEQLVRAGKTIEDIKSELGENARYSEIPTEAHLAGHCWDPSVKFTWQQFDPGTPIVFYLNRQTAMSVTCHYYALSYVDGQYQSASMDHVFSVCSGRHSR